MKPRLCKLGRFWYCGIPRPRHSFYIAWQADNHFAAYLRWLTHQHRKPAP